MKRTKIICTIGPASDNEEMMLKLAQAGMNMIRLNFSHGTYEEQLNKINICKKINKEHGLHIGMMLDTKGPEIRVGEMENDGVNFSKGDKVRVVRENIVGNKERFHINCPELYDDVDVGNTVLINDGKLTLTVLNKDYDGFDCEVYNSGSIMTKRCKCTKCSFINAICFRKDDADIRFGVRNGVDFIAASFVRRPEDVLHIKRFWLKKGTQK